MATHDCVWITLSCPWYPIRCDALPVSVWGWILPAFALSEFVLQEWVWLVILLNFPWDSRCLTDCGSPCLVRLGNNMEPRWTAGTLTPSHPHAFLMCTHTPSPQEAAVPDGQWSGAKHSGNISCGFMLWHTVWGLLMTADAADDLNSGSQGSSC